MQTYQTILQRQVASQERTERRYQEIHCSSTRANCEQRYSIEGKQTSHPGVTGGRTRQATLGPPRYCQMSSESPRFSVVARDWKAARRECKILPSVHYAQISTSRTTYIPSTLPEYPWERIATDLFKWKKSSYLLLVDYYSRFIEIVKLSIKYDISRRNSTHEVSLCTLWDSQRNCL